MRADGKAAYSFALIRTPFPATQCSEAATLPPRFCGRLRAAISGIPFPRRIAAAKRCLCLKAPLTAFPLSNCSAWKIRYVGRIITCPYRAYTGCGVAKQLLPLDNLRHVMLRGVIFEHIAPIHSGDQKAGKTICPLIMECSYSLQSDSTPSLLR